MLQQSTELETWKPGSSVKEIVKADPLAGACTKKSITVSLFLVITTVSESNIDLKSFDVTTSLSRDE